MRFEPSLTVIIPSCGRRSLAQTMLSISRQNMDVDILVGVDRTAPWGNRTRQRLMEHAERSHILFMDDDDEYYSDTAFETVCRAVADNPTRVHMFRMARPDGLDDLWREPVLEEGNVSTQMVCVPNVPHKLGIWGDRYQGDWDFIRTTCEQLGEPVWHKDVIALLGGENGCVQQLK